MAAHNGDLGSRRLFIHDTTNNLYFLIDTGADLSVLPRQNFKHLIPDQHPRLTAANGSNIQTYGEKFLSVNLGLRRNFPHLFTIAAVNRPIIGADFLSKFGILVDLGRR